MGNPQGLGLARLRVTQLPFSSSSAPALAGAFVVLVDFPEFHGAASEMGPFDLIEMVCDWWGATKGYGERTPWAEVLEKQRERFAFTDHQWWLIENLAAWLERELSG